MSFNIPVEQSSDIYKRMGVELFLQTTAKNQVAFHSHIHSAFEILVMLQGKLRFHEFYTEYECGQGDVVFLRPNTIHSGIAISEEDTKYIVMKILPDLIFDTAIGENGMYYFQKLSFAERNSSVISRDTQLSQELLDIALKMLEENQRAAEGYDIFLRTYAMQALSLILRNQVNENQKNLIIYQNLEPVYSALSYIHQNFNSFISADSIAKMVNMSYSHFLRCFSQVVGTTFKDYLNTIRLNQREKMLLTTDMSITDIAISCGYTNSAYFTKLFRLKKKMTPRDYRIKNHI